MLLPDTAIKRKPPRKSLDPKDAVDIWIARWLRIRRTDIVRRYGCDPRRIYEIWEGSKFPESRQRALDQFNQRYPSLKDRVDFGKHQRIPKNEHNPDQLTMFAEPEG